MKIQKIFRAFMMMALLAGSFQVHAEQNITHVVMVWLKEPGNKQMREKFIKASKALNNLPGVIHRHTGVVVPSDRMVVDDTFDVAVTVTLKNKQALQNYLNHPKHKKVLHDKIKPLVNRVVIYDFISE